MHLYYHQVLQNRNDKADEGNYLFFFEKISPSMAVSEKCKSAISVLTSRFWGIMCSVSLGVRSHLCLFYLTAESTRRAQINVRRLAVAWHFDKSE